MSYLDDAALKSHSGKASQAIADANNAGTVSGDHFSGTTVPEKGIFVAAKTPVAVDTKAFSSLASDLQSKKDHLKFLEDNKLSADSIAKQKTAIADVEKAIKTKAGDLYPALTAAKSSHNGALDALKEAEAAAKQDAANRHSQAVEATKGDPAKVAQAQKKFEKTNAKIDEHFKDLRKPHEDHIKGIGEIEKQLESKGFKASEFMSAKQVERLTGSERSFVKGISSDIKSNAIHGGAWKKVQVGIGGIGVIDGARRVIKGISGSEDPEKSGDSRMGNLVVGLGEIAGGVALAKMGGSKVVARS